jgi:hypothetical protein
VTQLAMLQHLELNARRPVRWSAARRMRSAAPMLANDRDARSSACSVSRTAIVAIPRKSLPRPGAGNRALLPSREQRLTEVECPPI